MNAKRIIIVDDHPLFRAALVQIVAPGPDCSQVEEAGDLVQLTTALAADRACDLILLDLNMPGSRGFSGLLLVRAQYPEIPVIIISAVEDPAIMRRCFDLGAAGYLKKSSSGEEIRSAIDKVLAGDLWIPEETAPNQDGKQDEFARQLSSLTPQQIRVLLMLSDGLMNKQIAYELSISEATVKAHVSAILQKLNVDSRTQAVILAAKLEQGRIEAVTTQVDDKL